jgi:hypothetical protein
MENSNLNRLSMIKFPFKDYVESWFDRFDRGWKISCL